MSKKRPPFLPGTIYHLYNQGNASENLFRQDKNFNYFLKRYAEIISPIVDTYAYCLMPNHFHFAIRIKDEDKLHALAADKFPEKLNDIKENPSKWLSHTFSRFFNAYASAYNKMYGRRGRLFYDSVERIPVYSERYFRQLIHYIHYNPIHHGFVEDYKDWLFSSIHAYLEPKSTQLDTKTILKNFESRKDFVLWHERRPDPNIFIEIEY